MKMVKKMAGGMKNNVKLMVLLEFILLAAAIALLGCLGDNNFFYDVMYKLIDLPSVLAILIIAIPSLVFMGEWKNFLKAFSVGRKKYTLLELKNINGAVSACQKLILYAGILEFIYTIIIILGCLDDPAALGPNVCVAVLTTFYAVFFECLLIPVKVNAERVMNEEIDIDVEGE